MAGFDVLTAVAVPIAMDNIDTDQIFPSRFQSRNRADGMFGTYFLHDERFDENGGRKDFILNDPRVAGARIIVASANYACGSARPCAIFCHVDYGIQAIIAESFGPVFPTVSYKSGLLAIPLRKEETRYLREKLLENPGASVTIDLNRQLVVAPDGTNFAFEIEHLVKRMFVDGKDEIDLTLSLQDKIKAFEERHQATLPWVYEKH